MSDAGALERLALQLLDGCGYTRRREAAALRADDQRVRSLVSTLLARAQAAAGTAEATFRRDRIPPPTRADPFPPQPILADARRLEGLARAIRALEAQVRHAPAPGTDRTAARVRDEAATLARLVNTDTLLVGQAEGLRALVADLSPDALLARLPAVEEALAALRATLAERGFATL